MRMHQADHIDTVIVGGGQSGLAMSYHLRQRGREHVILERRRVAERWRTERWDSLRFQLPNRWLELPGKSYAGTDPEGFVHYSDVLRFVLDYATEIAAPVRTGIEVTASAATKTADIILSKPQMARSRHGMSSSPPVRFSAR
jgi:cation diffusion facilitator CzcD-associated flavoprotein CzcO